MSSSDKTIKQHNLITQAKHGMSVYQLNIFFLLLSKLGVERKSGHFYRIHLRELEERLGKKIHTGKLKEATSKLRSQEYGIEEEDGSYLQVGVLASARYIHSERIIELELSKVMENFLFDLKDNFTTYQLQTALELKSKYAKRIYQLLCQFRSTGYYTTTIEKMRNQFELQGKYEGYSMFKRKVLEVAKQELEETDMAFTYKVSKRGRKYDKLEFFFNSTQNSKRVEVVSSSSPTPVETRKKVLVQSLLHPQEETREGRRTLYERMTTDFNLSTEEIQRIFDQFTAKEINKILYALNLDFKDKNVQNRKTYTLTRFKMEKK